MVVLINDRTEPLPEIDRSIPAIKQRLIDYVKAIAKEPDQWVFEDRDNILTFETFAPSDIKHLIDQTETMQAEFKTLVEHRMQALDRLEYFRKALTSISEKFEGSPAANFAEHALEGIP
jgi:hypothetical protein